MTLIKDINLDSPKRAHIEIVFDLYLRNLIIDKKVHNFDTLHDAWEVILNTEELNKRFYNELEKWYDWAVAECEFPDEDDDMQVIRMITRLLFIWFLQEKDLVPEDIFEIENAEASLNNFSLDTSDYYQAVLQNLFFATLNTPIKERKFSTRDSRTHRDASKYRYEDLLHDANGFLEHLKEVPFVNGGLFDCLDTFVATSDGGFRIDCFTDNENDRRKLHVPAKLFYEEDNGIFEIFSHYKFTVEENTPVEQEVALDPELLGQVFENLLGAYNPETRITARRATGSYYTPRQIVNYMVDEVLIAYLLQKVSPEDGDSEFLEERLRDDLLAYDQQGKINTSNEHLIYESEVEQIIEAINDLKIIDPAVGTGAFPMGILTKLVLILRKLDPQNERWKHRQLAHAEKIDDPESKESAKKAIEQVFSEANRYNDYGRKLYLIQNCIYGVDIQPIAITIAKLRFFISLIIEQRTNKIRNANYGIRPLPNLETKFVAANTLIGLKELMEPECKLFLENEDILELRQEIAELRRKHFSANTRRIKLGYMKREKECREQLAETLAAKHAEWREHIQNRIEDQVTQAQLSQKRAQQLREELQEEYAVHAAKLAAGLEEAKRIAHWDAYDQNAVAEFFDAEWMFGVKDGFDVVIGNPPYSKSENVPGDRSEQLTTYYGWGDDLYGYFIFAGFELVSEQGVFTYIANDSFVTLSTKRRIRDLFLENQLMHLVKAPANTFEATIYTAIFILLKSTVDNQHSYMSAEMNFPNFEYISNGEVEYSTVYKIPDCKFLLSAKNDWVLKLFNPENVGKYCLVLDTGIHSGNVRYKVFFKENNGSRHRLLQGKQIQRYSIQWDSLKAKYKYCDVNYEPLPIPGVGRGGKPSKQNEYWHFCGDIENHHQPERLLMRQSDDDLIVAYHSETELGRFYTDNTLHTILPKSQKTNLKYFLALFNSRLMNYIYHSISQEKGKSQAQVKIKVVRELPVVVPAEEKQLPIIALVDEILAAKGADPAADTSNLENEIDKLVYDLYDLTDDEIAIVEGGV